MNNEEQYVVKDGKRMRTGYTTGSCAAAAARAAAMLLLAEKKEDTVCLQMPGGSQLYLDIESRQCLDNAVRCTVQKDSGDDPDVTHQAVIGCTVSKIVSGFQVDGGEGVGRVTRPGLSCNIGEPAINPVPRRMIQEQLKAAATECGYTGGLRAVVDVPEGRSLALRTYNPRLGIVDGISILGTTGIVRPMSRSALIATIHTEIDCLKASGAKSVLVVPGNYGEDFAKQQWGLSISSGVKCSNFIGETLDYVVYRGFSEILIMGHAGKLVKLAAGIMNTHSRTADGRMEILAAHGGLMGLSPGQLAQLMDCVTIDIADELLDQWGVAEKVWRSVSERAAQHLRHRIGDKAEFAFASFGKRGVLMQHGGIAEIASRLKK